MFDYLAFYRDAHIALTHETAHQRVAHTLANLASTIGQKADRGIEVDVRNEELANEANVTPFTTSRLLSAWQRKGILTKSRGKILLRSPKLLFAGSLTSLDGNLTVTVLQGSCQSRDGRL